MEQDKQDLIKTREEFREKTIDCDASVLETKILLRSMVIDDLNEIVSKSEE
jgi:hypothetical protein